MLTGIKREAVIGMPVISSKDGRIMGNTIDIVVDRGNKKIQGLLLLKNGWHKRKAIINNGNIITIGEFAVIIEDETKLQGLNEINCSKCCMGKEVVGIRVISDDGRELGRVSDILINRDNGLIEGYEISKGFLDDLMEGRYVLSYDSNHNNKGNVLIVAADDGEHMSSYNKGLKRLFNSMLQ